MNLPDIPLLSMLKTRMTWLNQRQEVLTQNVANADTPGYSAHDLKAPDFSGALRHVTAPQGGDLNLTDPRHIALHAGSNSILQAAREYETSATGNPVSLEQEMIKVSDTQAQFQAATNLYAKAMSMMRTAIGH